ncbi:MAG TPA: TonB-dependent receptor [Methylococcaceae bacterium]|nr:TonB-dependent receptor [Methylococcaceae bacterium]HIA45862.1 TonB-dependent receptor [Methylococcaceae bacterium]HIN68806.1 TonB-dependent receptor [Methylococcales bacterium]HIO44125.1 TonB-dependent receptor [Methylococcales bacterium]
MKTIIKSTALVLGICAGIGPAVAEHEQLPSLVIEGSAMRAGAFTTAPDSTGLKDTASLLERVPGANVNRNGPLTGIAVYRGMFGNRVTSTIDAAALKEAGPNSMDPPLSHYPAALTESLTVHRGIAPVSSGIETLGGSMHAKSRKGQFAEGEGIETHGVGSMGYSSVDDGYVGALMGSIANQNHKLHLSGSQEKGGDYTVKGGTPQENTQYDRNAFSGGYGYQRAGHEFGLNYSNTDLGTTGAPALPMDIAYVKGGLWDMHHNWDLRDGVSLKTDVFYQKMRHLMSNSILRGGGSTMMDEMLNRTKVEAGGLSMALSMSFGHGELIVGVDGDQSNHDANQTMNDTSTMNGGNGMGMGMDTLLFNKVERDRYSVFTEWSGSVTEDVSLELGARYTHTWSDAGQASGFMNTANKAATDNATGMTDMNAFNAADRKRNFNEVDLVALLRYQASSTLDVEVGLARKNRAPTYQELYLFTNNKATGGFADGNTYIGDLELELETAYQFNLGFDWHTDKAYFSPQVFYHYVDDYIQGVDTAASDASKAINMMGMAVGADLQWNNTEAQLFGVDLEAGYQITDFVRADAGLNYVRGMRVNAPTGDKDLYRMAPLNGRTQLTYENAGWQGSVEGIFYADQGDVAGYNGEQKTKGYMVLNLRGQYEAYKGLVIATGIENVLDEHRFNHLGGYAQHNRENGRVAMPGRNLYATLGYTW